jgi:hypothetical protein
VETRLTEAVAGETVTEMPVVGSVQVFVAVVVVAVDVEVFVVVVHVTAVLAGAAP